MTSRAVVGIAARIAVVALGLSSAVGCGGSASGPAQLAPPSSVSGDTVAGALRTLIDRRMVVTHRAFSEAASALAESTKASAESSTESCSDRLEAIQKAWRRARVAWDAASVYRLGPQFDAHLAAAVDYWPVDSKEIERIVRGARVLDDSDVDQLGAPARGLPGIEHVLFGPARLTERRCSYVRAAARSMVKTTDGVLGEIGRWKSAFVAGPNALVTVLSALAESAYRAADEQLAMPAGRLATANGPPDPSLVHGGDGAMAVRDVLAELQEIGQALEVGIQPIVVARYAERRAPLAPHLEEAIQAVSALGPDLRRDVVEDNSAVAAAADRCHGLRTGFATNLSSALGVTLIIPVGDGD